ncbi:Cof-type HAD-IIB family hydrolase [Alicyclobacillus sp. SO9]|uniref:Cof-type HAD-IIB family hydrolase n=1 Tax=Alicyclobacillus sp. SO9 TaxID=2665646 RepID=UPI0018E7A818|nr:Cof-type HAD-IIB family hydrolase [Alicyclobacillus sp. SO9]
MIKTVFFDIDGTLVNWQGNLLQSTKRAVLQLRENGVTPVIASARPAFNIYGLMQELGIASYVALNGSLVVYENETIYRSVIQSSTVDAIRKLVLQQSDSLVTCTSDGFEIASRDRTDILENYMRKWDMSKECAGGCEGDVLQLEVMCSSEGIRLYTEGNRLDFYPWGSREDAFNAVNRGISKASGIEKLLAVLHQDRSEAAAFGDGINDIEMMSAVGIGVAMGNAVDELKHRASFVTLDVNEGGIAHALEKLGLI